MYWRAVGPASRISDNTGMASATTSSLIACSGAPLQAVESDFLVVPWFEGETASAVAALDPATGGEIGRALASKEFSPRPYELFVTPVVDRTYPLAEAPRAVRHLHAGHARGKIVITV